MSTRGYASGTKVSVSTSIGEIRTTLQRFGATQVGFLENDASAAVAFVKNGKHVRFTLALPPRSNFQHTATRGIERSDRVTEVMWRQAMAERWRALALAIKAKVVSADSEIETFEQAFFAHIIVPGENRTLYETMEQQLDEAYSDPDAHHPLQLSAPRRERVTFREMHDDEP